MLSTVSELAAFACFVVAGWLVAPFLGLVVAGVVLLLISRATDGVKVKAPKLRIPKAETLKVKLPRVRVTWPGHPETANS